MDAREPLPGRSREVGSVSPRHGKPQVLLVCKWRRATKSLATRPKTELFTSHASVLAVQASINVPTIT